MRILVTGCYGFIGSAFIRDNESDIIIGIGRNTNQRHKFRLFNKSLQIHHLDLAKDDLSEILMDIDVVVHFGAKTFVDHSIRSPEPFVNSNIVGTYNLLEAERKSKTVKLHVQVSTDEVYGAILTGAHQETSPLNPTNPYSATKAAADLLCMSYFNTYKLPIIITRTENNYGPFQGKEKAIPTFVRRALNDENIQLYGDGQHERMWMYVDDHVSAIRHLINKGTPGQIYHVAGEQQLNNIQLAQRILELVKKPADKIEFIPDMLIRPGHDRRYALDTQKIRELGWKPKYPIDVGLPMAVQWYVDNQWWLS